MVSHKFYKYCIVPQCGNTTATTSNKLFICLPQNPVRREKWFKLANIDKYYNSRLCFCEDHFDMPNDMANYMEYHIMGSVNKVMMKPNCLPSKFECQSKGKEGKKEHNNLKNKSKKKNLKNNETHLLEIPSPAVSVGTMQPHQVSQEYIISKVKQEMDSEINDDVQIKTEIDDDEETLSVDNSFANEHFDVKKEYRQSPVIDNQTNERHFEVFVHVKNLSNSKLISEKQTVPEIITTNIYDDCIEIKEEHEIGDSYDSNFDDEIISSDDKKALNDVETDLQEDLKIICEDESFEASG